MSKDMRTPKEERVHKVEETLRRRRESAENLVKTSEDFEEALKLPEVRQAIDNLKVDVVSQVLEGVVKELRAPKLAPDPLKVSLSQIERLRDDLSREKIPSQKGEAQPAATTELPT